MIDWISDSSKYPGEDIVFRKKVLLGKGHRRKAIEPTALGSPFELAILSATRSKCHPYLQDGQHRNSISSGTRRKIVVVVLNIVKIFENSLIKWGSKSQVGLFLVVSKC